MRISRFTTDAATRLIKDLKKRSDAFSLVRGVVPPELSKQLLAYAEAVVLIQNTVQALTDPEHDYMDCELTNLIVKAAKQDKKFRKALKLLRFKFD